MPLLKAVDRKARALRISRNQLVVRALEREVRDLSDWSPGFFERLPKSKRRELLQQRFDAVRTELGRVQWTDVVSESFGAIKAELEKRGTRIEDFDAAIAAHALAEDAVLVTANLDQLTRVSGLNVEDWSQ